MKLSLKKVNQLGVLSLHVIIPLVLVITAIGGVGAYVMTKSKAYGSNVCYISPNTVKVSGMTGDYYHMMVQNRTDAPLQLANMKFQAKGTNGTATIGYYDASGKPTTNLLKWASGFNGSQLGRYATATGFIRKPVSPNNVGAANYKFAGSGKTFDASCQVIPAGTSFATQYSRVTQNGSNAQYAITCELISPKTIIAGQPATFIARIKNTGGVAYSGIWDGNWFVTDSSSDIIAPISDVFRGPDFQGQFTTLKVGETKDIAISQKIPSAYNDYSEKLFYNIELRTYSMTPGSVPTANSSPVLPDIGSTGYCTKAWALN